MDIHMEKIYWLTYLKCLAIGVVVSLCEAHHFHHSSLSPRFMDIDSLQQINGDFKILKWRYHIWAINGYIYPPKRWGFQDP